MKDAVGKLVATRRYFHISLIAMLGEGTSALIEKAAAIAGAQPESDFNVIRIDSIDNSVALLSYPTFFEEACPPLARSWKVSIEDARATLRNYQDSLNPPILHRKELLLDAHDTRRPLFQQLTTELETLGCFEDPVRIGFKLQWEGLLRDRGFRLTNHQLVPIGNAEAVDSEFAGSGPIEISRHLTALTRHKFSAPIQILQRLGYLDGSRSILDYGCGKGDDVRGLRANGLQVAGWDPHYASAADVIPAGIVNLGFVINVIEDPVERRDTLLRAFALAEELLVVSAMVATDNPGNVRPYGDGMLTSRATFQKYFTQAELRVYLGSTLLEEPISVAPGIFFVFKDKQKQQLFEVGRQRTRIRVSPLSRPMHQERNAAPERGFKLNKYDTHRSLLESLWTRCIELGREPADAEVPNLAAIKQAVGSLRKALRIARAHHSPVDLERARNQRADDLKVFLALQQFQGSQPYKTLTPSLQRDVRAFFGNYTSAHEHARQLLLQVAKPEVLDEGCRLASEHGLGWLLPGHSLQLHSSLIPRLSAVLRVYVGCAAVLYGDVAGSDVIKIHIRSGKVSFMKYDDFIGSAIPKMVERAKINLRTLEFELYTYGSEWPCPPLYFKSRYMNEELPNYAEQLAFDEALQSLNIDLSGYGPTEPAFTKALDSA